MRVVDKTILGKERRFCFSTWANIQVEKTFGGVSAWAKTLGNEDRMDRMAVLFQMAEILTQAGARYDDAMNLIPHEPLGSKGLVDLLAPLELMELQSAVIDALRAGQSRTVAAESPKNSAATPGEDTSVIPRSG